MSRPAGIAYAFLRSWGPLTGPTCAYRALGFQRARVRGIALRCEQLVDAAAVAEQLSFDQGRERRFRAERAIDLLNARFGSGTVGPAASCRQAG